MSEGTKHQQSDVWDKALDKLPSMICGRLDLASYDGETGEAERFVYVEGTEERTRVAGPHCDHVAYAANRYQPLRNINADLLAALKASHKWMLKHREDTAMTTNDSLAFGVMLRRMSAAIAKAESEEGGES